jgi:hypothetical protein
MTRTVAEHHIFVYLNQAGSRGKDLPARRGLFYLAGAVRPGSADERSSVSPGTQESQFDAR